MSKGKRVLLDEDAYKSLVTFLVEIKNSKKHIKVNEGRLVSEIVRHFFKKSYPKDKNILIEKFFDKQAFLKDLIVQSKSNEEMITSLKQYLGKQERKGRVNI